MCNGKTVGVPDALDLYSDVPLYRQVAAVVEREIRAGQWQPGSVVQSRTQLAQRFGVATETARHAMQYLAERGYLVPRPGVGMLVTPADRWPS